MLIRTRLLRAHKVFLLSGALLAAGQAMSAQSAGAAQSQAPQPVALRAPVEPSVQFADVVRVVEKQGRHTTISSYIAEDLGMRPTQTDSSPVQARAMGDGQRELCVVDDTGALLFMHKDGDVTTVYLADHAGALQEAGYFQTGRFHSQNFKGISKAKAAAGFAAEKEFWAQKTFPSKYGAAIESPEPVGKPSVAKPKAVKQKDVDRKAGKEAVAAKTTGTADAYDEEKLSQMTPKERIKYLDQQIREAKQQEKLEKEKEKAKKSAEKDAPATDGDTAPPKKKISWF